MKIRKAYKFRLKLSAEQIVECRKIAGACRFVWNKVLWLNRTRLHEHQAIMRYYEADFWVKLWKHSEDYDFLRDAPAHCLQQKLRDLDKAYRDGFDKAQPLKRLPTLRRRGQHDSFRFPEPKHLRLEGRRIKVPKLGWLRFYKSRRVEGELKNATLSQHGGHWTIALQVEQTLETPVHSATSLVGLDLGIAQFATLSTGEHIASPHAYTHWQAKLARAQRIQSRKQRFSKNWCKAKAKVQRIHAKIAAIRRDFLHKLSTHLSQNHAVVVLEALKISNMSRSARGTLDAPGQNVRAKAGLNRAILDQGWGEFRRQLSYKLAWLGGVYVEVSPQYTSQRCHRCGHTSANNRQTQADFCCEKCGFCANADVNAACNIRAAGHAVLACGEEGLPFSMKQEPLGTGDCLPA